MGASANRKPKTEANLQNDAVLGDLLGQIKTSAATKSDSKSGSGSALAAKPKLASSTLSNQNSTKSHSNPFAVRPASTGLKKKCAPETEKAASSPSVKAEPIEDDDATALSQLIEDDDFSEPMCMEPEMETPTQKIEDDDEDLKPTESKKIKTELEEKSVKVSAF